MPDLSFDQWVGRLDFDFWSTGKHKIGPAELIQQWFQGEAVLLDVRSRLETQYIALPFAIHMPIDELPTRWEELPRDKLVATFCSGGERAGVAYAYLHAKGLDNARILKGAYADLMAELLPGKLRKLMQDSR